MKPRVFLSHSKKDKELIEKLANDLRSARIDVWYDEWEIPPGKSFRKQIFEEGIPNCDLFFLYLTPHSAESYWVSRELDAAFVADADKRGGFMAIFVDNDSTRSLLSLEIQALHIPVLSTDSYIRPLIQLVARAWENRNKRMLSELEKSNKLQVLQLQKDIAERDAKIANMVAAKGNLAIETIISELQSKKYTVDGGVVTLDDVFIHFSNAFAAGITESQLRNKINITYFKVNDYDLHSASGDKYYVEDFTGPLVLAGVIKVYPPQGDSLEVIYITDLGIDVARELLKKPCNTE